MNEVKISGVYIKTIRTLKNKSKIILLEDHRKNSDRVDNINVILNESMCDNIELQENKTHLNISGRMATTPRSENHRFKNVIASSVSVIDNASDYDINEVTLTGEVEPPIDIRHTNHGVQVMDLNVKDSDVVIPCVAFGPCTSQFEYINPGTQLSIVGRIQSRKYFSCKRQQYEQTVEVTITKLTILSKDDKGEDTEEAVD